MSNKMICVCLECGLFTNFVSDSLDGAQIINGVVNYKNKRWIRVMCDIFCSIYDEDKESYRVCQAGNSLNIPKDMIVSIVVFAE